MCALIVAARRRGVAAAVLVLVAGAAVPTAHAGDATVDDGRSPALCGPQDEPETGIQGDVPLADQQSGRAEKGYNCALTVVGHHDLDGASSAALAWSGECAYVRSSDGIRVLDVSDPTTPVQVGVLPIFGSSENMTAATTDERAVLVYGRGVYDVRDCTRPVLLGQIDWSGGVGDFDESHNVKLNRAGTEVYASFGVKVADISDLDEPASWTVDNFNCATAAQVNPIHAEPVNLCQRTQGPQQLAHEPEGNHDGTRLYVGNQTIVASAPGGQAEDETLRILDVTGPTPRVVAQTPGPGHGLTFTVIGGTEYLLHSDETAPGIPQPVERRANGCLPYEATPFGGAAESYLTDMSNEIAPQRVSHLGLAINRPDPASCLAAAASSVNSTIHYHTVDDPDDATFAMLSMKNAGLRIFDIRVPEAPREVAYFNPGQVRRADGSVVLDRARTHTRYDRRTGLVWLLTEAGGFWVLDLQPQVRDQLGLDDPEWRPGDGRPPWAQLASRPGADRQEALSSTAATIAVPRDPWRDSFLNYCRL